MTLSLCLAVFAVILVLANGILAVCGCAENKPAFYSKIQKKSFPVMLIFEAVLLIFSVLSVANIPAFSSCTTLWTSCAVTSALFIVGDMLKFIIPQSKLNFYSFALKAVVVIFMAELTIFNFNSYDMLSKNYTANTLNLSQAVVTNGTLNSDGSVTLMGGSVEFSNINMPVGSITVDIQDNTSASVDFSVKYADDTNAEYRSTPIKFSVINENLRSKTVPCAFSGNVSRMLFTYDLSSSNSNSITINSISVNNPIAVELNVLRIFIFLFFAILCYSLLNLKVFKKPLKDSYDNSRIVAIVLSTVFLITAFTSISIYRISNNSTLADDFSLATGNQITKELVDAFESGKVELDIPVDETLKNLDNPYDWSERETKDAIYSWDHVYYNGTYYSYYGIAPVILLFLPYHLITGYYFPTVWAVMLFGGVGIVFLIKLLNAFMRRYFPNIPFGLSVMASIIVLASCGVWFNFVTPNFYEIAQTSGFACVTAGAFFMITSNILDGKPIYWRVALSTICLALAVLCRPTLAVYCIAAVLFIIFGFIKIKNINSNNESKDKKNIYFKYLLCAVLPFVLIGSVQMIYNYVRFGSFIDFGIDYSLTINDFTRAESHLSQIFIGFLNFLFLFPLVDTIFPFIHSNFTTLDTNGYYFIANTVACGIIFKALPMFSYLFAGRAYRLTPRNERKRNTLLITAVCLVAPFAIIYSIAESGYGVRYATDFAWQMILGAFIVAFTIYCSIKNESIKKILTTVLMGATVISIVINFAQLYEYQIANIDSIEIKATFLSFARCFEFWK